MMVRLSRKPVKINIDEHLPAIREYLGKCPDIAASFIYGSYGTEFQLPLSDVDLAVLFTPGGYNFDRLLEVSADIANIAREEDVNVVALQDSPITLQYEVISTGRLLQMNNSHLDDFVEYVLKRYADYKIDLDIFNMDYDDALREVYLDD
jgi:predicted nucleotidyltransferase